MKHHIVLPVLCALLIILVTACDDDADDRNKFIGRYEVTEQNIETSTYRDEYEVRIRKDPGTEAMVVISNFYNLEIDAIAAIQGNTITVIKQEHYSFEFEGSGVLQGNTIILNYTVSATNDGAESIERFRAEMTLIE